MDWNDSYIASAFLPIAIRLSLRVRCYYNSGSRKRIVQARSRSAWARSIRCQLQEDLLRGVLTKGQRRWPHVSLDTIRADRIRDDEVYGGVRVLLEVRLGNVRVPLQIDVGLGDAIVPGPEELEYPTLLKFPAPKLRLF
jgi:hypothetical protein